MMILTRADEINNIILSIIQDEPKGLFKEYQ